MTDENEVLNRIRLQASKDGYTLWRNNSGAACIDGRWVRWGLANDSKKLNENIKSSDLIGIRPRLITLDMVGDTIGQFVAYEIKASNWFYRDTKRERAQKKFIELVNTLGGEAKFLTTEV
jgi:hypothetical protein